MAKIVGVSPTTVSNVIRGKTKEVSPQMVEKIQKVLKEYNYIPNMTAVNLAKKNSNVIGFVMNAKTIIYDNVVQDFFTSELIGGLEVGIRKKGYYMMIYISENIDDIIKFVSSWNVDGLVGLGFNNENAQILREVYKKPLVFVDGYFFDDGNTYSNVGLEDYKGAYEMTNYLLSCGHRRIGFFSDNYIGVDYERYRGFQDAYKDAGLDPALGEKFLIEITYQGIQEAMDSFMKRIPEFTAVFFCSDNYAVGSMTYMIDHGIKVPDDISVAGFDDAVVASFVRPRLTTVHQSTTKKAEVAIEKLIRLIENPDEKDEKIILPVSLQIRDSVKKLV